MSLATLTNESMSLKFNRVLEHSTMYCRQEFDKHSCNPSLFKVVTYLDMLMTKVHSRREVVQGLRDY